MRILMMSHGYPPTVSGVTLVAHKTARAMVSVNCRPSRACQAQLARPFVPSFCGAALSCPLPFSSFPFLGDVSRRCFDSLPWLFDLEGT